MLKGCERRDNWLRSPVFDEVIDLLFGVSYVLGFYSGKSRTNLFR